jgi:hypothetical protein
MLSMGGAAPSTCKHVHTSRPPVYVGYEQANSSIKVL